jgi:parvulin-like peptidyl-prolyl isomerase
MSDAAPTPGALEPVSHLAPVPVSVSELASHRLWRTLLRARLLEASSAETPVEDVEFDAAWLGFCKKNRIDPSTSMPVPADLVGCESAELRAVVLRELKLSKWKSAAFGADAKAHFERRKPALDRVVYSLLRVKEPGLARELWFRLSEGEASFAELAPDYASGNEVYTAGIVGPVAFGAMHPALAALLKTARPGEILKPVAVAEWFLVARVDHFLPVEFDEGMKLLMIEELCQQWVEANLNVNAAA